MTEHATEPTSPETSPSTTPPSETPASTTEAASPPATDVAVLGGNLDARIRYAREIAAAGTLLPRGVLDGIRPGDAHAIAGRVFLIAETGNMLGVHPIAALQGVHVIEGKPTLSPALMGALVRRAGHRFRVGHTGRIADGTLVATASVTRHDDPEPFVSTWDLDRAQRAGLLTIKRDPDGTTRVEARGRSGKPGAWENYTEAMLKARATSEVCREAAEDVLMGVHYTPEELGAIVDGEGGVVESLVVEEVAEPTPEEVAQGIADKVSAATETVVVEGLWARAPAEVGARSWAHEYTSLGDFAGRVNVTTPDGRTVTLRARFGERHAELKGPHEPDAGPQGATPPPAPPGDTPAAGSTPQEGPQRVDEDIVDAEVIEPDAPAETVRTTAAGAERVEVNNVQAVADVDPWATAPPSTTDDAVATVAAQLGGEVVDVEGEDVDPRTVAHATRVADAARTAGPPPADVVERDDPAEEQGHRPADPAPGETGYAAFVRAKAQAATQAEASKASREASASSTRKASTRSTRS